MKYLQCLLVLILMCLGGMQGCVSRPETAPESPIERTTINAPTVVNQADASQLSFQVSRDPNDPNRGWVLIGNQPIPVRFENGAWVFDRDLVRNQPSQPTQPAQPPPPTPSQGGTTNGNGQASTQQTPSSTIPPNYMSIGVAQELLAIEKMELYRALIARMRVLAANTQVGSVDEFNIIIQRLEGVLQEMERIQQGSSAPPQN